MARDYKDRASTAKKAPPQKSVSWWKWALVVLLITLFVFFLLFLRDSTKNTDKVEKPLAKMASSKKASKAAAPKHQNKKPQEPHFDFYTILPETEIEVPDYEIDTRKREEKFGKAKARQYIVQAGSFRQYSEADKLRAQLALIGVESRVEKAQVGAVIWNRVKMGPFKRSSSVTLIKKRLKDHGIDAIVTEIKG